MNSMSECSLDDYVRQQGHDPGGVLAVLQARARGRMTEEQSDPLSDEEIELYRSGGFDPERRDRSGPGPDEKALADLVEMETTSLSVGRAAEYLGLDESKIQTMVVRRELFAFEVRGEKWLPRFQFHDGAPLPGLAEVLEAMSIDLPPLAVWRFFTTPQVDLPLPGSPGGTTSPRVWLLAKGSPATVAGLARDIYAI